MFGFAPLASRPIAGTIPASNNNSGEPANEDDLATIVVAGATAAGTLDVEKHLAASAAASASATIISLDDQHHLVGTATSVPNAYASIDIEHHLAATQAAAPAAFASLDVEHHLAASVAASATATPALSTSSYIATTPGISAPVPVYRCRMRNTEDFVLTLPINGLVATGVVKMSVGLAGEAPIMSFASDNSEPYTATIDAANELVSFYAPYTAVAGLLGFYRFDVTLLQLGYRSIPAAGTLQIEQGVTTI